MFLLKGILFLLVAGLVLLLFVFLFFGGTAILMVRSLLKTLRGTSQENADYVHVHRKGAHHEEDIVIDRRSPQQANRQIFGDDEGEYIDYENVEE